MDKEFIALLDSGIGGIFTLKKLTRLFPNENFLYYGDNLNAPYGNKSVRELEQICFDGINQLLKYKVKCVVLACNTLSANVRQKLSQYYNFPIYGVFPPVEKYLIKGEKILLLATERTIEQYQRYKKYENLHLLSLNNLAKEVEGNLFSLSEIDISKNLKNSQGQFIDEKGYYDRVILGCTHYNFVKNKIYDHFCPRKICCGDDFTASYLSKVYKNNKSSVNHKQNQILFIGDCAKYNQLFWVLSGQYV